MFLKYILFLKTRTVRYENGKRNYASCACLSEDYKTGMPAQATVRDVPAILFAKPLKFVSSTSYTFEASKLFLSRQIKID